MRFLVSLCALWLGACANIPPKVDADFVADGALPPSALPLDLRSPVLGLNRGVVLLDTRALRDLRRSQAEQRGLSLLPGQRVALWVGVGFVVVLVVAKCLEDNVAFFP